MTDSDLSRGVALLSAAGFDAWEAYHLRRTARTALLTGDSDLKLLAIEESGLGIRACRRDRRGFVSTTNLGPQGLRDLLDRLDAVIRSADPEAPWPLAEHPGGAAGGPQTTPPAVPLLDWREAESMLREAASSTRGPGLAAGECRLRQAEDRISIRNSRGLAVAFERRGSSLSVACRTDGGHHSGRFSQFGATVRDLDPASAGRRASMRTAALAARKARVPANTTVVLGPWATASLLQRLSPCLAGEGERSWMPILGEAVGSGAMTLVDDPRLPGGAGSSPFDDEGVPAEPLCLAAKGILQALAHHCGSAAKAGSASTGHGLRRGFAHLPEVGFHNLCLAGEPGITPEALLEKAPPCLYLEELAGSPPFHSGYGRLLTGWGWAVRDGQPAEAVGPVSLADALPDLLLKLARVAGQPLTFPGGTAGTTALFEDVRITG
ncbi:MAG: TldD/PmbA family protein [Acidobacteriota bacterium]